MGAPACWDSPSCLTGKATRVKSLAAMFRTSTPSPCGRGPLLATGVLSTGPSASSQLVKLHLMSAWSNTPRH